MLKFWASSGDSLLNSGLAQRMEKRRPNESLKMRALKLERLRSKARVK